MIGFDCGTYNLVVCTKDDTNYIYKREVNAFIKIPLRDKFVFTMMKNAGVPLIERSDIAYALGESAVKIAYTLNDFELKRPMKNGCVNAGEKEAFEILNIMIHSLLDGNVKADNQTLYYTVPGTSLNKETDPEYHKQIIQSIFNAYTSDEGYKVSALPINEALAIVYAEASNKKYTAVGASFGSGQINVCFAMFGAPIFTFSIVNSGDWIDEQAAKATGENITFINQEKEKIDLTKQPKNMVERAIQVQYRIMLEKTVDLIKKGMENSEKKVKSLDDIDIILAGGTSLPNGFTDIFKEILERVKLPIKVGNIYRPMDPLYSVARGCLIAAENSR